MSLSVFIFEPSFRERKRSHASALLRKRESPGLTKVKEELRVLRVRTRDNLDGLLSGFLSKLRAAYGVNLYLAEKAEDASAYIREMLGDVRYVSLNKSSVVVNELRPLLADYGLRTYIRYFGEFKNLDPSRLVLSDYWALPDLHRRNIVESFELEGRVEMRPSGTLREYAAVLGVNAACAMDGSLFFLQHMSNISKDLLEAAKIFFIVPIEKIVEDLEGASLHVKAMGIFGLESLLLDLRPRACELFHFEALPTFSGEREVHVIVLDNGRRGLLQTPFSDLLLCIDCRACAKQCPVGIHLVPETSLIYSPKNLLLLSLQGKARPFELCLHCGRCEVECPCGIEIPKLLWESQLEFYRKRPRGLKRVLLDNPELLAKIGGLCSPLSNAMLKVRAVRILMELMAGIHRDATLPSFKRQTLRTLLRRRHG